MMRKVRLPRRMTSIRTVVLVFIFFALYFHYHLLRECIKSSIQNEDNGAAATGMHILLSPRSRQRQPPPSHLQKKTRKNSDNQTITTSHRFQRLSPAQKTNSTIDATLNIITPIEDINNDNNTNNHPSRKWAYAFLVSGCSEKKPGYKGFLYNIVVAAARLRDMGSVADVVVMIQMSESTDSRALPAKEEQMLFDNGIKIRYLPKMRSENHECFYALVQEKFRALQMVKYSRVLFIDADTMPLCNLDYMFELSEPSSSVVEVNKKPLLKTNVIIAGRGEGANAGFFMMKPNNEDWEQLQREIRRKEEKALTLPWPHWDEVEVSKREDSFRYLLIGR